MILGGGLKNGSLPDHVLSRCSYVLDNANKGDFAITSSSFSLNVPPHTDNQGFIISEASVMANYMNDNDLRCDVITEQQSHDTFGAFFFIFSLYFNFIKFKSIEIITSDFHIE